MHLAEIQAQDLLLTQIRKVVEDKKNEMALPLKTIEEYRERSGYIMALRDVMRWMDEINREIADKEAEARKSFR